MTMRFLWLFVVLIPNVVLGKGVETEVDRCEIKGDPHLKTFSGQSAPLPWPCVYPVTKLDFNNGSDTFHVEVFATSDSERYGGQFFVSFVQVTVKDGESVATFTVNATTAAMQDSADVSWVTEGDLTGLMDEYINVTSQGSEFVFTIGDVELLTFRPVNKEEKVNHQSSTPGLFVEVPQNGPLHFADAAFPATVCSTPEDKLDFSRVDETNGPLKRKEQVMIYYGLLYDAHPDSSSMCLEANRLFRECFETKHMTAEVAQEKLLNSTKVLTMTEKQERCISAKYSDTDVMTLFAAHTLFEMCYDENMQGAIDDFNLDLEDCDIDALITTGSDEQALEQSQLLEQNLL